MLWVSLKCLVFLTVGVSVVVAIAIFLLHNCPINRRCWNRILSLVRSVWRSWILQRCETTWTTTSKEARSAQTLRRHHSCLFRIDDTGYARHPGDAHHHVEVDDVNTLRTRLLCHSVSESDGAGVSRKRIHRLPHRQG